MTTKDAFLMIDPAVDHLQGMHHAPLTVVEYGDYACPSCAEVHMVMQELKNHFEKNLCFIFRQSPLSDISPAARAAEAAAAQNRFWAMHACLFTHRDALSMEDVTTYAHDLDLDMKTFLQDLHSSELTARIRRDHELGALHDVDGTPTIFINSIRYTGSHRELESVLHTFLTT